MTKLYIFISLVFYQFNVSTQYYIVPEKETSCNDELPGRFISFLESEDAYGETSEYFKVCKTINKNLDIFPERAVGFDNNGDEVWIDIKTLRDTLTGYLAALESVSPNSIGLKYDPRKKIRDSLFDAMITSQKSNFLKIKEYNKLDSEILNDNQHPYYYLPPDHGYISDKKLNEDLLAIIKNP
jgi:hypothetical protein